MGEGYGMTFLTLARYLAKIIRYTYELQKNNNAVHYITLHYITIHYKYVTDTLQIRYNTIQFNRTQYSTTQYSTTQYSTLKQLFRTLHGDLNQIKSKHHTCKCCASN